jgi:NADH:ubiquinone oxidoreductase subunit D
VRQILRQAVETTAPKAINKGLGYRIHNHFARIGGVELELPTRSDMPSAPELNP